MANVQNRPHVKLEEQFDVKNDKFIVNNDGDFATKEYVDEQTGGKQESLTAGKNIDITDNVISATINVKDYVVGKNITIDDDQVGVGIISINLPVEGGYISNSPHTIIFDNGFSTFYADINQASITLNADTSRLTMWNTSHIDYVLYNTGIADCVITLPISDVNVIVTNKLTPTITIPSGDVSFVRFKAFKTSQMHMILIY